VSLCGLRNCVAPCCCVLLIQLGLFSWLFFLLSTLSPPH
jgi:hypothetical protein